MAEPSYVAVDELRKRKLKAVCVSSPCLSTLGGVVEQLSRLNRTMHTRARTHTHTPRTMHTMLPTARAQRQPTHPSNLPPYPHHAQSPSTRGY
jgi:hypothetical protein